MPDDTLYFSMCVGVHLYVSVGLYVNVCVCVCACVCACVCVCVRTRASINETEYICLFIHESAMTTASQKPEASKCYFTWSMDSAVHVSEFQILV